MFGLGASAIDMQHLEKAPVRMKRSFDLDDKTNDISGLKAFKELWTLKAERVFQGEGGHTPLI